MKDFYGTEIEIWAGFGPVGINEKKIWVDYEQLLRQLHKMKLKKPSLFLKQFYQRHLTAGLLYNDFAHN